MIRFEVDEALFGAARGGIGAALPQLAPRFGQFVLRIGLFSQTFHMPSPCAIDVNGPARDGFPRARGKFARRFMKTVFASTSVAAAALLLAACSGGPALPSLSTGSVTGGADAPAAAGATPVVAPTEESGVKNDPTQRAFQVGSTSARAVKCGYNFDPAKLKQQFLAAEATQGTGVADIGKVEKIYDVSFNGISRGIATKEDYCTEAKSKEIKQDLTRHLAGDYAPRPVKKVATKNEGGLFSGLFDGGDEVENGPKMGTDEWWQKQSEKMGR